MNTMTNFVSEQCSRDRAKELFFKFARASTGHSYNEITDAVLNFTVCFSEVLEENEWTKQKDFLKEIINHFQTIIEKE